MTNDRDLVRQIERGFRQRGLSELPRQHRFPLVGTNVRNGLPVSRDPATGELWTLYPGGNATGTITDMVALDPADRDCAA